MGKISRNEFLDFFGKDAELLFSSEGIRKIKASEVTSFSLGKKVFHSLNKDSYHSELQSLLVNNFLENVPLNNCAYAYRKKTSYFLKIDIKNFFPSITRSFVRDVFSSYFIEESISDITQQPLIDSFLNIVGFDAPERKNEFTIPIGFKTSPYISNIVFRPIDIRIQKYCNQVGILYSRYADDIIFSSQANNRFTHSERFISEISYILSTHGFKINPSKTISAKHTISIGGYVLCSRSANRVSLSNKKLSVIQKAIHSIDKGHSNQEILKKHFDIDVSKLKFLYNPPNQKFLDRYSRDQLSNKLLGYRSFLISIIKFNIENGIQENDFTKKINLIIEKINQFVLRNS